MSLFLWENTGEEFLQLFLLFLRSLLISHCVFLHIFLRKHNRSQLTRSQGEHDHGNDVGDQSQWRISGKAGGEAPLCDAGLHKGTTVNYPNQTQKEG